MKANEPSGIHRAICAGCGQEAVTMEAREKPPAGLFEKTYTVFRICPDCKILCESAGAIKRKDPLVVQPRTLQWLRAVKGLHD